MKLKTMPLIISSVNPLLSIRKSHRGVALVSDTHIIPMLKKLKSVPVEVESGKTLNINPSLTTDEHECLITLLKKHKGAFAWEYTDMKGIPSNLCTHHIYIKSDSSYVPTPTKDVPQFYTPILGTS